MSIDPQRNFEENMSYFIVSALPADVSEQL